MGQTNSSLDQKAVGVAIGFPDVKMPESLKQANPYKKYDTTLARIAGNIASALATFKPSTVPAELDHIATVSVDLAQRIVAKLQP